MLVVDENRKGRNGGRSRTSLSSYWLPRSLATWWTRLLLAAFATLAVTRVTNAQGCAMCYNDAAAASATAIRALHSGILVLITPALAIFVTLFVVAYRKRDRFDVASRATIPAQKLARSTR